MNLLISPVEPDDLAAIGAISDAANEAQVFPMQSEEGRATLLSDRENKLKRLLDPERSPSLKAVLEGRIVGYVTWRDGHFVTALYVSLAHQGLGIGRRLMDAMIERAEEPVVRLRASVNAVEFYRRYGFQPEGGEQILHGIRFVPMAFRRPSPE
ncbi:GNAT family N-acetyltransferase [Saccharospirillum salsuginis]|uniref:N-acetyltransferase domain-containing protein n=1 Tax=Saccharospirillum salsuginis TaxID=418750 RepID=A0A918KIU9_9GAMM|nr:GNAT family N-acetyltransferase [Saccharospirillum salsuginis]GGX63347.1 hypothetical protein GCM10007392_34050 [Saccharospirillum salsuginis]